MGWVIRLLLKGDWVLNGNRVIGWNGGRVSSWNGDRVIKGLNPLAQILVLIL